MDYIVPGEMELMSAVIQLSYHHILLIVSSAPMQYLFLHQVRSVSCNSSMSKCNKTEEDDEYSKVCTDDHDDGVYTTGQYAHENRQKIALLHEN